MNEKYLQMYARLAGVRCTVLRPSNIYGNGQRLDKCQGLIGVLANKALQGKPVEIWGDGKTLRDYIHVDDVVNAVLQVMKYKGSEDVFNLSTGIGVSALEIVEIMQSYLTERLQVIRQPARRYDVSRNVLDAGRMKREFGWTSEIRLESSIKKILTV
jgi:UDP-glucose 4-epimerase